MMPLDADPGTDSPVGFPDLRLDDAPRPAAVAPPPPPPPRPAQPKVRAASLKASRAAGPRIETKPGDEEFEEEFLPPESIKGWAISAMLHATLIVLLGLCVLTPKAREDKVIDTRLAGNAAGSEASDQLTGGLGIDTPLELPDEAAKATDAQAPTFTSIPAAQLNLDAPKANPNRPTIANGSGPGQLKNNGAQAGTGDGFGVSKFGSGGENINGVAVKVGDPQFTLIWDSKADIDLHVLEPGGSHIYWENRAGDQGAELDVDDIDGFGPENIFWVQGKGPPGEYRWYVFYYGGNYGLPTPTRWKVRLKHNGETTIFTGKLNAIGQKSQTYSFKMSDADSKETVKPADAPK